jgi:hypothetical protein
MNPKYKAFYKSKQPIGIWTANTSREAQQRAAEVWDLKPSLSCKITVVRCDEDREVVTLLPSIGE